jgi:predicted secreted protein
MISIDKTVNGNKIQVKKGDIIKLQLAENPTTAYLWKINSINNHHLNYTENKYETSGEAIGAGGMKSFYFEVITQDISELQIVLGNPWENDVIETFKVTIES